MINLVDVVKRLSHQCLIEHRTFNILHTRGGACGRTKIENADPATVLEEDRNQVLADKTAATRNERARHRRWSKSARPSLGSSREPRNMCWDGLCKSAERSRRKPSAMKSFATMNIGPISI